MMHKPNLKSLSFIPVRANIQKSGYSMVELIIGESFLNAESDAVASLAIA
jgi:hypothetical protein